VIAVLKTGIPINAFVATVFAKQCAKRGQHFTQSGITGFTGGQQSNSFIEEPSWAATAGEDAPMPPAAAPKAVSGESNSPKTARIGSGLRMKVQHLTCPGSHTGFENGRIWT